MFDVCSFIELYGKEYNDMMMHKPLSESLMRVSKNPISSVVCSAVRYGIMHFDKASIVKRFVP